MSPPDNKSLEKSIRNLAQILLDTGLTEIEVDSGETRIRVARNSTITQAQITPPPPPPTAAPIETKQASPPTSQAPADEKVKIPEGTITSPMVGTVYLSSEPGAAPFVSVGDPGQKRPDHPHHRSDENHEPYLRNPRRQRQRYPRRRCASRRVRPASHRDLMSQKITSSCLIKS